MPDLLAPMGERLTLISHKRASLERGASVCSSIGKRRDCSRCRVDKSDRASPSTADVDVVIDRLTRYPRYAERNIQVFAVCGVVYHKDSFIRIVESRYYAIDFDVATCTFDADPLGAVNAVKIYEYRFDRTQDLH